MLGHLGVNVPDLRAAKEYYTIAMPLLGFEEFLSADDQFAFRPSGGRPGTYVFFYPSTEESAYSRHRTGLQHLAFMMPSRGDVDRLAAAVAGLVRRFGGHVLHAPRHFPEYPPPYYAMFWLDPWGLMIEAVCHHDRP